MYRFLSLETLFDLVTVTIVHLVMVRLEVHATGWMLRIVTHKAPEALYLNMVCSIYIKLK